MGNIQNSNSLKKGKYKNQSGTKTLSGIFKHNYRSEDDEKKYHQNENIALERTHLNYDWPDTKEEAMENFKTLRKDNFHLDRKDCVEFISVVVSAPKELVREDGQYTQEDLNNLNKFFQASMDSVQDQLNITSTWIDKKTGEEKTIERSGQVFSASVHMDETTPHIHILAVPMVKDRDSKHLTGAWKEKHPDVKIYEDENGQYINKFSNKDCCGVDFFKHFHEHLKEDTEKALGRELSVYDEEKAKSRKHLSHEEYLHENQDNLEVLKSKRLEAENKLLKEAYKTSEQERASIFEKMGYDYGTKDFDLNKELYEAIPTPYDRRQFLYGTSKYTDEYRKNYMTPEERPLLDNIDNQIDEELEKIEDKLYQDNRKLFSEVKQNIGQFNVIDGNPLTGEKTYRNNETGQTFTVDNNGEIVEEPVQTLLKEERNRIVENSPIEKAEHQEELERYDW